MFSLIGFLIVCALNALFSLFVGAMLILGGDGLSALYSKGNSNYVTKIIWPFLLGVNIYFWVGLYNSVTVTVSL